MSTATTPTAATSGASVHKVVSGFTAITEQGHWDACSIIAEIAALHPAPWCKIHSWGDPAGLSGLVKAWRNEYIAAGRWDIDALGKGHGTSLANIHWHMAVKHPFHLAGYLPSLDAPTSSDHEQLHSFVKDNVYAGNTVIVFVTRAYNLPHNQAGVQRHFVTLGGIDSKLGYLVANGDTDEGIAAAAGTVIPCHWATWGQLLAAGVNGAIAVDVGWKPPVPIPPTPIPTPTPTPVPVDDAMRQALAELQADVKRLAELMQQGG